MSNPNSEVKSKKPIFVVAAVAAVVAVAFLAFRGSSKTGTSAADAGTQNEPTTAAPNASSTGTMKLPAVGEGPETKPPQMITDKPPSEIATVPPVPEQPAKTPPTRR